MVCPERRKNMKFCMECGTKLEERFLENEGMVPYCPTCEAFRFPVFNTAVIMIVMNAARDRILLIQQYGRPSYILVAGYVNKGEDAENAVRREIKEEIGLDVVDMQYNRSEYFENTNTLMLSFACTVSDDSLDGVTTEVDKAAWFAPGEACREVRQGSLAHRFLADYVQRNADALHVSI